MQGIPVHLWSEEILVSIAENVGHLEKAEVTPTYFRMRVTINGLKPLIKKRIVEFPDGSKVVADLIYDKLQKHCKFCCMLDLEEKDCLAFKSQNLKGIIVKDRTRDIERDKRDRRDLPKRRDYREERSGFSDRALSQEAKSQRSFHRSRVGEDAGPERSHRSYGSRDDYHKSHSRTPSSRNDFPEGLRDKREDLRHGLMSSRRRTEADCSRGINAEVSDSHHGNAGSSGSRARHDTRERLVTKNQESRILPQAEVEVAMGELREVMIQYANCPDPTESAARRERVRLAEEQGEFIQTTE